LMKRRLIPLSTVITPNIPEAEVLTGVTIRGIKDIQQSARLLHQLGAKNVVIKGGHYRKAQDKTFDIVFDGSRFEIIRGNFYSGKFHGTGCAYSSALTVYLGQGLSLYQSAKKARCLVVSAIRSHIDVGLGMSILGV
ncbi:MAG: PfkB family carbohydrate kinase, partial [Thermodesulfovibrionales bacterium]